MLFKSRIVVLDTETTGIFGRDEWAEVVELGAVIVDCDGREVAAYRSLVKPSVLDERAAPAMAVNKIDPAVLVNAREAWEVILEFVAWCVQYDAPFLTAYNVAFDRAGIEKMGLSFKEGDEKPVLRWASCIMEKAKADMRVSRWLRLSVAAEHYGVPVVGEAHRAETDARTAAGVMCAIQRKTQR